MMRWGLPDNAAPADIAAAEQRQERLARSFLGQQPSNVTIAAMRRFAEAELGLTPQQYDPEGVGGVHWPAVWAAMRDTDHRYCRLARSESGVGWIIPPADTRVGKIEALASDPGATAGEAAAARAALERIAGAA